MRGLDDLRAWPVAQGSADAAATVDHDDLHLGVGAQGLAQAGRHFGGGLDAGEAATGDHYRIAGPGGRTRAERADVLFQAHGFFDLVDVEGMLDTGHLRPDHALPVARTRRS